MPTPATHLALAEEMLRRNDLSAFTRRVLTQQRGPFLFGHTAPDVKTVSGQRREVCHFYALPRKTDRPAYQVMLGTYPSLAQANLLLEPHAAFIAGYIAHLVVDEVWLDEVFQRYFLQGWGAIHKRLFLHNVLRTWVDGRDQVKLNGSVEHVLRGMEPQDWLPFVDDRHLRSWRDWLVAQLSPGERMQTAEVFARRMGIAAGEVEAIARSDAQMEKQVFRHFPRSALASFREIAYTRSVALVESYFGGGVDDSMVDLSIWEETHT
jgi:hypothetical protein